MYTIITYEQLPETELNDHSANPRMSSPGYNDDVQQSSFKNEK